MAEGETLRKTWLKTILGWDLYVSLALTVIALVAFVASGRELEDSATYSAAAAAGGLALLTANGVMWRWVADKIEKSEYGRLIRIVDEDSHAVSFPYRVMGLVSTALTAWGVLGFAISGELSGAWHVGYMVTLVGLSTYGVLGTYAAYRDSMWHSTQMAKLERKKDAIRAELRQERLRRERDESNTSEDDS